MFTDKKHGEIMIGDDGSIIVVCKKCGRRLLTIINSNGKMLYNSLFYANCPKCGVALEWEEA